jgi:hypothetical protein
MSEFDGWFVVPNEVMPRGDLRPHIHGEKCWCRPADDDGVLVHNAIDRREFVERGEAKLQ